MEDHNLRFARLVQLCEAEKLGKRPTMNDDERVAVALVLNRSTWLRSKGLTVAEATQAIGTRNADILERVRQTVADN